METGNGNYPQLRSTTAVHMYVYVKVLVYNLTLCATFDRHGGESRYELSITESTPFLTSLNLSATSELLNAG